jgi:hypothetical protein
MFQIHYKTVTGKFTFVICFIVVFYINPISFHRIWQKGSVLVHLCRWIYQSIKIFQNVEMSANVTHTRLRIVDMLLTLVHVLIDVI